MSLRCVACNSELCDSELLIKKTIFNSAEEELEVYEDMCYICKGLAFSEESIFNKEYEHSHLTDGTTPSSGFSDDF